MNGNMKTQQKYQKLCFSLSVICTEISQVKMIEFKHCQTSCFYQDFLNGLEKISVIRNFVIKTMGIA